MEPAKTFVPACRHKNVKNKKQERTEIDFELNIDVVETTLSRKLLGG